MVDQKRGQVQNQLILYSVHLSLLEGFVASSLCGIFCAGVNESVIVRSGTKSAVLTHVEVGHFPAHACIFSNQTLDTRILSKATPNCR